jgi:pimeloyl-ACP methyl ester carboxylesterase
MEPPLGIVPQPDPDAEPDGFVVVLDGGDRLHFLDWGGPPGAPGVLLVHGLSQTSWIWAPVARRLAGGLRVIAADLRGHGLSDAPTGAYPLEALADDAVAVAEGAGILDADRPVVLAGHGFGAIVAAVAARRLGPACAGLVLVDGGWEDVEGASGMDVEEFLRGLDEPPEVLASLDAFLADRTGFDPASWDADQERAARATVVETHAGRVVPATRPHALEASVRAMFQYDPVDVLPFVEAVVVALVAADDETGSRAAALATVSAARVEAGRGAIDMARYPHDGHNLPRYRPAEVAGAILSRASGARTDR